MNKYIFFILFFLIIFSIFGTVSAENWTVGPNGNFTTIQEAIDSNFTQENDTIIVNSNNNSYNENIIINKRINLLANGPVTIHAPDLNMPTITISAGGAGTIISGFTIIGGKTGILILSYADNCTIKDNYVNIGNPGNNYSNVNSGSTIDGGIAVESDNVIITGNTVNGNRDNVKGITVLGNNCSVIQNNIYDAAFGIFLGGADNCNVTNNSVTKCYYGIDMECNENYATSNNCIISQNDIHHNVINGIRICGSRGYDNHIRNIKITNNTIAYNGNETEDSCGIYMSMVFNYTIKDNEIHNNNRYSSITVLSAEECEIERKNQKLH